MLYLAVGAASGLLAGLLGIGGGIVVVPALAWLLPQLGVGEAHTMHVAVGTSLACIVFTACSSAWAHHRRGAVRWPTVGGIAPGLVVGALVGAWIADWLSGVWLSVVFAVFAALVGVRLIAGLKPSGRRALPGRFTLTAHGLPMGTLSALVGIGGGSVTVPYFVWHRMRAQTAVASGAACGLPIAVTGAVGFILSGLDTPGLPPLSLGYVYLPALAGIVVASVLAAPAGARLAHALPAAVLGRVFGAALIGIAILMAWP